MSFILDIFRSHRSTPDEVVARWNSYIAYIKSLSGKLPPGAYAYAISQWHSDYSDNRSPHDAWVERLLIHETAGSQASRFLGITIDLLGSYQNGRIRFSYWNVGSYSLHSGEAMDGHGDWLADEVELIHHNLVAHTILLSRGGQWRIEAEDFTYTWTPFVKEQ